MPKDFAKKKAAKKTRGASRSSNKKSSSKGLWIFTLLLIACLAGGLTYLKSNKRPAKPTTPLNTKTISTKQTNQNQQPITPTKQNDVPAYDMHDDLINKEVKIPKEDLELPENLKNYYYSMRCGAFRESSRAEELKAQIAMTGNNSNIVAVQSKGDTWHRVELGPFNRKRAAESIRHRLQDNNIQGCIINKHIKK